jgi:hypothetical protein
MSGIFSALIFGLFFGFLLDKARLTKSDTIVNQFRFKDFTVLKYMLTTLIVAMPIIYLMKGLGFYTISNVPNTYIVGNLLGGVIFGVGMAIGGF